MSSVVGTVTHGMAGAHLEEGITILLEIYCCSAQPRLARLSPQLSPLERCQQPQAGRSPRCISSVSRNSRHIGVFCLYQTVAFSKKHICGAKNGLYLRSKDIRSF